MSYTLDFLFTPRDDLGLRHEARIYVKTYSTSRDGHILLTLGECLTPEETDAQVERLKNELDEIGKKVKKKFRSKKKKSKQVSGRNL